MAVTDLHFAVEAGEILGLVGPNGAGKTTTLRGLAGIIPPTRGELRVAGHDVVADPISAKQQVGYVPDEPRLFEALTVWEHLQFVAAAYRGSVSSPLVNRPACDRSARARVSNQSAISAKPSSRAVFAIPGYICVYS